MGSPIIMQAAGFSVPVLIRLPKFRGGVGMFFTLVGSSTGLYTVQVTGDPPQGPPNVLNPLGGLTNWNNLALLTNMTTSQNSNLVFPCSAVRVWLQQITGSFAWTLVQVEG